VEVITTMQPPLFFIIGYAVAMDGAGDVVATGYFQGTVDLGGGPLTSVGAQDALVLSLGP